LDCFAASRQNFVHKSLLTLHAELTQQANWFAAFDCERFGKLFLPGVSAYWINQKCLLNLFVKCEGLTTLS
jgi:hypothetical protein